MPAGFRPFYSLQDATGTTTGRTADIGVSGIDVSMHIVITGQSVVKIEASDDGVNFTNVSNPANGYSASTVVALNRSVPYYRARISSYSNGLVTAMCGHGRKTDGTMVNISEKGLHT